MNFPVPDLYVPMFVLRLAKVSVPHKLFSRSIWLCGNVVESVKNTNKFIPFLFNILFPFSRFSRIGQTDPLAPRSCLAGSSSTVTTPRHLFEMESYKTPWSNSAQNTANKKSVCCLFFVFKCNYGFLRGFNYSIIANE